MPVQPAGTPKRGGVSHKELIRVPPGPFAPGSETAYARGYWLPREDDPMGTIIFQCPITGQEYASCIEMDEASFLRLPDIKMKSRCPHCGADHVWSLREARLSDKKLAGVSGHSDQERQPGS